MTTTDKLAAIVSRHHSDPTEGGRTCRACGRPWPCDVQEIAAALQHDELRLTGRVRSQRSQRAKRSQRSPGRAPVRETVAV